jgi:hypothetical protein
MRRLSYALILGMLAFMGWSTISTRGGETGALTPSRDSAVENNVREFMQQVGRAVTADGPIAWSKFFENRPSFFMAVNGKMAFPSGAAAMAGIPDVAKFYKHIHLQWGDDLRVDVLTPALAGIATSYHESLVDAADHRIEADGFFTAVAEYRDGRWQFRNVHWSQPVTSAAQ